MRIETYLSLSLILVAFPTHLFAGEEPITGQEYPRVWQYQKVSSTLNPTFQADEGLRPVGLVASSSGHYTVMNGREFDAASPVAVSNIGRIVFQRSFEDPMVGLPGPDTSFVTGTVANSFFGKNFDFVDRNAFVVSQRKTNSIFGCPAFMSIVNNSGLRIDDPIHGCRELNPMGPTPVDAESFGRTFETLEMSMGSSSIDLLVVSAKSNGVPFFQIYDITHWFSTGTATFVDEYAAPMTYSSSSNPFIGSEFGYAMEEMSDMTGDGNPEIAVTAPLWRNVSGISVGMFLVFEIDLAAPIGQRIVFHSFYEGTESMAEFGRAISSNPGDHPGKLIVSSPYANSFGMQDNGKLDLIEFNSTGAWQLTQTYTNIADPAEAAHSYFGDSVETILTDDGMTHHWVFIAGRPGGIKPKLEMGMISFFDVSTGFSANYDDNLNSFDEAQPMDPITSVIPDPRGRSIIARDTSGRRRGSTFVLAEGASLVTTHARSITNVFRYTPELGSGVGVYTGWLGSACSDVAGVSTQLILDASDFMVQRNPSLFVEYQNPSGTFPNVPVTVCFGMLSNESIPIPGSVCETNLRPIYCMDGLTNSSFSALPTGSVVPAVWAGATIGVAAVVNDPAFPGVIKTQEVEAVFQSE